MRLKEYYDNWGEATFTARMINLINEDKDGKVADGISLTALWEAMGRPDLSREKQITMARVNDTEITEAMDSSAFPKITAALINKHVQSGYDMEFAIGDQLVTVIPSSVKDETIVGFADDSVLQEVPEGIQYQEGSITEKYHNIKNRKFGRILSLTEENIKFDQTGQIIMRAKRVGEMAKAKREEIIMNAVLENASTGQYASWRPAGTATTLYSNTSTDPYSSGTLDNYSTNTLGDESDIDELMQLAGAFTDEQGLPLHWSPKQLLTGVGYQGVAAKILRSGQAVKLTTPSGTANIWGGMIAPLNSAWVDSIAGTKVWLLGDFPKQFIYTEVFPLGLFQAKAGHEQEFERDVIFRYKARLMGGCGAVTNRYVIYSTGAS